MLKKLKLELFYWRQMIHRRFPLRYFLSYIKNRYFGYHLLKNAKAWRSDRKDDFELHVLAPKSGLWMLYWNLRSFMYFSGLAPKIFIHSDGTIDEKAAGLFESKFSNLKVIARKDADRIIDEMPDVPDSIKKYRYGRNILILLLTDIYLLSKTEKVMLLDFDILFFDRPLEIIDFMQDRSSHDVLSTRFSKGSDLFMKDEYLKKYDLIQKGAHEVISGIITYKKKALPMERFIEYFENTLDPENHFIEQAGWASLVCQSDFTWLDEVRYPVKGLPAEAVCKHFTTPRRFELYAYGIEDLKKKLNT
jgi:hypothetical protein